MLCAWSKNCRTRTHRVSEQGEILKTNWGIARNPSPSATPFLSLFTQVLICCTLVIHGIRELSKNKGVEMALCSFTQRTRKHVAGERKKALARIRLDFSMPEQQRCYWPNSGRATAGAERSPELRNKPWSPPEGSWTLP